MRDATVFDLITVFDLFREGLSRVLLGAVLLTLSGCMTTGRDFSTDRVREIEVGKTTWQDIQTLFGAPWRIGNENGQQTWTYGQYKYKLFGAEDAKDLVIRFDRQGTVRSFNFNTTAK